MRFVARNFFTVVAVVDVSSEEGLATASSLFQLLNQNLPARVGVLPIVKKGDTRSEEMAKIVRHISQTSGGRQALMFLNQVLFLPLSFPPPLPSRADICVGVLSYSWESYCHWRGA
jgi:hypothetical protein